MSTTTATTEPRAGFFRRHWFATLVIVLLSSVALYFGLSKQYDIDRLNEAHVAELDTYEMTARNKIDSISNSQLELTTRALVWAVRSEVVRENAEQVDQYFRAFVKYPQVKEVFLLAPDQKVWVSSNKKSEGTAYGDELFVNISNTNGITTDQPEEGIVRLVAPVLSVDSRIGTLVVLYHGVRWEQ